MGLYPGLSALNIMGLHSPQSAVLSAIIYNALIIIALIPLALKGVKYREVSAGKLLSRNLLVYGLGGLAAPFIFVKLIDILLVFYRSDVRRMHPMNAVTKKTISYFEGILGMTLAVLCVNTLQFRPVGTGIASENFSHNLRIRGYIL